MEKTHGTVEQCLSLDSRRMAKYGVFNEGESGSWVWRETKTNVVKSSLSYSFNHQGLTLSYTCNGENYNYLVSVKITPCHYGGVRYWFNCPRCHKRVAKLYLQNAMYFCRTCQHLNYDTQQSCKLDSTRIGMYKIRNKLQWQYETAYMNAWQRIKPKGMHHTTYNNLVLKHDQLEEKANRYCIASFKSFMNRYG